MTKIFIPISFLMAGCLTGLLIGYGCQPAPAVHGVAELKSAVKQMEAKSKKRKNHGKRLFEKVQKLDVRGMKLEQKVAVLEKAELRLAKNRAVLEKRLTEIGKQGIETDE